LLPADGEVSLNRRHRELLVPCVPLLGEAARTSDPLVAAECVREVRMHFDRITGRAGVEDMLDALFSRFCIGK